MASGYLLVSPSRVRRILSVVAFDKQVGLEEQFRSSVKIDTYSDQVNDVIERKECVCVSKKVVQLRIKKGWPMVN